MVESAESFGKYTLLEKVAVGGMAEIYRAKTEGLGGFEKLLAIKRLHPQFGEQHDVAKMLVDEARIAVHLTHPNIAQIFDLGCIDEQYFIAMEYIDGVDLHQVHKTLGEGGESVPVPALVFAMAEALSGLHYAHTRTGPDGKPLQIVHRDVSPQNIMISYEGEVKLVDFGIAKAEMRAQEDTQHGIIKGKFYYMSPEQAYGHHIDARTDVFAAGMVLYELLAGRNPYTRIEEYELLKAVRKADFPPISSVRPDVEPELEEIISRATQRDANYRYQSAREMQLALMSYLDRRHGPYRRMELAKFIRRVADTRRSGPPDGAKMSRVDYEATEASMIFEPGTPITDDRDAIAEGEEPGDNPFDEDEPTQLWTPDAPEPAASARDADTPNGPAPADLSAPQFLDLGGLDSPGPVPEPKAATAEAKLPLHERLLPSNLERSHLLFGGIGLAVVLLGGVLTVLLMGEGDRSEANQPTAASTSPAPVESAPRRPGATVDVQIVSSPRGAKVFLDGESMGNTPTILEDLSTGKTYDLELTLAGYESASRTIQPSKTTERLDFELSAGGAVLKVATYPPNATIEVDGERAGRSPVDIPGLSRSQTHTVVATLDDGRTTSRSIEWEPDDERVKQVELTFDDQSDGEADAPGAQASKDEPLPRSRPERKPRRRRKKTRPPKRSTGSSTTSADLDIWGNGGSAKSSGTRAKSSGLDVWGSGSDKAARKGSLSVKSDRKVKVYVDGKLVRNNTSSYTSSLAPGTYSVRVYFLRLKRYSSTKRIRIQSGETSQVSFSP